MTEVGHPRHQPGPTAMVTRTPNTAKDITLTRTKTVVSTTTPEKAEAPFTRIPTRDMRGNSALHGVFDMALAIPRINIFLILS